MATTYTATEVAKHATPGDLWVTIDNGVYDLSKFANLHPGGLPPLTEAAGQDATVDFYGLHRASVLENPRFARLKIGTLAGAPPPTDKADLLPAPYVCICKLPSSHAAKLPSCARGAMTPW